MIRFTFTSKKRQQNTWYDISFLGGFMASSSNVSSVCFQSITQINASFLSLLQQNLCHSSVRIKWSLQVRFKRIFRRSVQEMHSSTQQVNAADCANFRLLITSRYFSYILAPISSSGKTNNESKLQSRRIIKLGRKTSIPFSYIHVASAYPNVWDRDLVYTSCVSSFSYYSVRHLKTANIFYSNFVGSRHS